MFRLLKLLSNFRNPLLFIVLELLAFIFIVQHNDHQRHVMGNLLLETTAEVNQQQNKVLAYLHLPEQNDSLVIRTLELQQQYNLLEKKLREYNSLQILNGDSIMHPAYVDSLISAEEFAYIPCHAIKNSVNQNYNNIVIDKGSNHGIKVGMGLVSPQGIAGRVVRVSEDFSLALSAINISFKLSAKAERSGYVGGLYQWQDGDPQHGYLDKLPPDVGLQIEIGERIVTSGTSTIFPNGYLIGHVVSKSDPSQDGLYRVKIRLATNFNQLYNLFAIDAKHKVAIDSLEADLTSY